MEVKIQKWGNSLALRIPRAFSKETKIEDGSVIEMTLKKGKLIIEPREYHLSEMLNDIDETNTHTEIDFGRSRKELL